MIINAVKRDLCSSSRPEVKRGTGPFSDIMANGFDSLVSPRNWVLGTAQILVVWKRTIPPNYVRPSGQRPGLPASKCTAPFYQHPQSSFWPWATSANWMLITNVAFLGPLTHLQKILPECLAWARTALGGERGLSLSLSSRTHNYFGKISDGEHTGLAAIYWACSVCRQFSKNFVWVSSLNLWQGPIGGRHLLFPLHSCRELRGLPRPQDNTG